MPLNLESARKHLQAFDFRELFNVLGWSVFSGQSKRIEYDGQDFLQVPIAELAGVTVFEVSPDDGEVPDGKIRRAIHRQVLKDHREHILIFLDANRMVSDWYWVKNVNGKEYPRDHFYFKGQSGDLILSKLNGMVFDIKDFDADGNVTIIEVMRRLSSSLDTEPVQKKFYGEFQSVHEEFVELIEGIDDPADRKWYASVLLNRLMFIYFMQKKRFVDHDTNYLWRQFLDSQRRGKDIFYSDFLSLLFFEGFAKEEKSRSNEAKKRLGDIRYLNGGLFLHHPLEIKYKGRIRIPDKAFSNLLRVEDPKGLFERFTWALDDRPGSDDRTINPDVLGYIFEKYINQKAFGAYYTRPEITEYLCERTINQLVLERLNKRLDRSFGSLNDALVSMDKAVVRALLLDGAEDGRHGILADVSVLDPACGSGAFLIAAMKRLFAIYVALVEKIKYLHDNDLDALDRELSRHASREYGIKKRLITDNIYGVDLMDEAVEICRLRLFLALVSSVDRVEHLEPLPNIDFNVMAGNSLIGLMKVDPDKPTLFGMLGQQEYARWLDEKNTLVDQVRHLNPAQHDVEFIRDEVSRKVITLRCKLNDILLTEFSDELKIAFDSVQPNGNIVQRELTRADIDALRPFHWGFEFDEIVVGRGGFDIIITNPPWEAFKPSAKEFFSDYSDLVTKNKMDINEFEKEQDRLLDLPGVAEAWAEYRSRFPHMNRYFRNASGYGNQDPVIDGKRKNTDINLFKLFTERTVNLMRPGGLCGIVIPSGIYTDLGCKQLREMLFSHTQITGLFGFENRKKIFEGVDSRFKFVVLTFEKGGKTKEFPAVFMRHDVSELDSFPRESGLRVKLDLIRKLSPDSMSLMEFGEPSEVELVEKMYLHPVFGVRNKDSWGIVLRREFHTKDDRDIIKDEPGLGRVPLYEGRMIHQFTHTWDTPTHWVDSKAGMARLQAKSSNNAKALFHYESPRFVYREIASNTNERTFISTILPPGVFTSHKLFFPDLRSVSLSPKQMLYLCGVANSFCFDFLIRMRATTTISMHMVYPVPVPRLKDTDKRFLGIVKRTAQLICITLEFDDLAKEAGLGSHEDGVTAFADRARLRAELDGLVAHLYGLTEEEFVHILSTFPLVADPIKVAAHNAYRDVEKGLIKS